MLRSSAYVISIDSAFQDRVSTIFTGFILSGHFARFFVIYFFMNLMNPIPFSNNTIKVDKTDTPQNENMMIKPSVLFSPGLKY